MNTTRPLEPGTEVDSPRGKSQRRVCGKDRLCSTRDETSSTNADVVTVGLTAGAETGDVVGRCQGTRSWWTWTWPWFTTSRRKHSSAVEERPASVARLIPISIFAHSLYRAPTGRILLRMRAGPEPYRRAPALLTSSSRLNVIWCQETFPSNAHPQFLLVPTMCENVCINMEAVNIIQSIRGTKRIYVPNFAVNFLYEPRSSVYQLHKSRTVKK